MTSETSRRAVLAAFLGLTACAGGERVEGLELKLGLTTARARRAPPHVPEARVLLTDEGVSAALSGALFTLGSVELLPCPETGWRRLFRGLSPVGTAWAHSTSNARRLGSPQVLGLGRWDGDVVELGVLHPPPGRYCHARLTFEPADADAHGLDSAAAGGEPVDMVGRSLHLRGTVATGSGPEGRAFRVDARGVASVDVALDALTLSEEAPTASLVFALAWDMWLDGVGPGERPEDQDVLGNVARSASLRSTAVP
ncbi:MAG TPA: hypothetical protein VE153_17190 [Myxococcus sp.]|nr:hypothetical protein [Myxococcus sp.]